MRVVDTQVALKNMGGPKSVQNWGRYIGEAPERLGLVATMYPENTLMNLVDSLRNVYTASSKSSFNSASSTVIEWNIDVNFIKKVYLSASSSLAATNGAGGEIITVLFKEKYFDPFDVFTVGNGKQNFIVLHKPKRLAMDKWAYQVRLNSGSNTETVASTVFAAGNYAVYSHNQNPEWSERGYVKYQANNETHRQHMTTVRHDDSWSMQYAAMEDHFIEVATKEGKEYLQYKKKEKHVIDSFMTSRESQGLFGISNFDVNGKCLVQDNDGQDLPSGDGIIKQIERYADHFEFTTLTTEILTEAIKSMRQRSGKSKGNKWVVMCNTILDDAFGLLMKDDLRFQTQDGNYFYSAKKGGDVEVGANFVSYNFQGNVITFMPSKAFSDKYQDKAYGVILDAGIDETTGKPNIAGYSLKGNEFVTGMFNGVGGQSGTSSGVVSTPVTGSTYTVVGTAAYVVHNPYKAVVLEGSIV